MLQKTITFDFRKVVRVVSLLLLVAVPAFLIDSDFAYAQSGDGNQIGWDDDWEDQNSRIGGIGCRSLLETKNWGIKNQKESDGSVTLTLLIEGDHLRDSISCATREANVSSYDSVELSWDFSTSGFQDDFFHPILDVFYRTSSSSTGSSWSPWNPIIEHQYEVDILGKVKNKGNVSQEQGSEQVSSGDIVKVEVLARLRETGDNDSATAWVNIQLVGTRPPDCKIDDYDNAHDFGTVMQSELPVDVDLSVKVSNNNGDEDKCNWRYLFDGDAGEFLDFVGESSGQGDGKVEIQVKERLDEGEYSGKVLFELDSDGDGDYDVRELPRNNDIEITVTTEPPCKIDRVQIDESVRLELDSSYRITPVIDHEGCDDFRYRWLLGDEEIGDERTLNLPDSIGSEIVKGKIVLEVQSSQSSEVSVTSNPLTIKREDLDRISIESSPSNVTGRTAGQPCPEPTRVCLVVNDGLLQTLNVQGVNSSGGLLGFINEILTGNRDYCKWQLGTNDLSAEECRNFKDTFASPNEGAVFSGTLSVEFYDSDVKETKIDSVDLYTVPWPFSVQLLEDGNKFCSASVVKVEEDGTAWILTAAHCATREKSGKFSLREELDAKIGHQDDLEISLVGLDESLELALYRGTCDSSKSNCSSWYSNGVAPSVSTDSVGADVYISGFPGLLHHRENSLALTQGSIYAVEAEMSVLLVNDVDDDGEPIGRASHVQCRRGMELCTDVIIVNRDGKSITGRGMSGSPVYNSDGIILGVHSSSSGYNQMGNSNAVSAKNWESLRNGRRYCKEDRYDGKHEGFSVCSEVGGYVESGSDEEFIPPLDRIIVEDSTTVQLEILGKQNPASIEVMVTTSSPLTSGQRLSVSCGGDEPKKAIRVGAISVDCSKHAGEIVPITVFLDGDRKTGVFLYVPWTWDWFSDFLAWLSQPRS